MEKVISTEKHPIKLWLKEIEDGAVEQAKNVANLPFLFKHVALMPDAHFGYGVGIGTVLATSGVVIPNAVGKDISCGMATIKTSLKQINKDTLKKIMSGIRKVVPVGFEHHKSAQPEELLPKNVPTFKGSIVNQEYKRIALQLGTLGGG